ncbi:two-component system sensor histidine kinase NtrB [Desulfococcus multivorans]|uniref:histidine kinase n=1 Tax=Desulfococcus multivorans DSM 2059 TaxID=1121405 RepID=S7UP91_DESML|nr:ATP-binding protein [Desulfococcus multivorans]AOY59798.1 two component system sensor histidine kinase [Desulfococcus multivorans]AQV01966.1 PAS domain-containing sensor histidine kinase [Desulfococcus multivorans]EPR35799.1 PAS/PAC sensor signal transduction histidine kinase [Desulfococcus multivorans DSM 2059]SJZ33378.1 PAS domain S-box-containing protein [Desulfococcus multivorans DSM 2059]
MHTDTEKEYLIRAIDGFRRKIIVVSPEYVILAANAFTKKRFSKNIIGRLCHEILWNLDTPCEECPLGQITKTRSPTVIHKSSFLTQKKNYCHYFYPLPPSENMTDEIVDAIAMLDFDIPFVEGLEEKLQRSNAFLKNLILSSVDGVIAADRKGKIFIFNDAAVEITGYSMYDGLHKLMIQDIYAEKGCAYDIMKKLRSKDYGGKGKLKFHQVDIQHKNGMIVPIRLNAAVVYDGKEEVATIGFFHDLREEIKMKEKLEKTRLQLLQADKMASLGKLSAGVAHQLNNPLGSITLFTKLVLEEYALEESIREDLSRILKDAQRCRDTVKELLEFARQTRYQIKPHDINRALSRTLFLLDKQTLFHNIEICKHFAEGLPMVPGDIQQLNHVFMNLIINAAQAMGGNGKLSLKTEHLPARNQVLIEISDTGPGIPDEVLPHIFDPFYTTKDEGEGTGLGLSLAYSIIKEHHGLIEARNAPEGGAVFSIELPLDMPETTETDH